MCLGSKLSKNLCSLLNLVDTSCIKWMCVFSQLLSFVYSFIVEPCFFVRCLTLPIYKNGTRTWTYIRLCVLLPIRLTSRRRRWHPTPVLLPGKSHGRWSLVCCSPWGREESDTTEGLPFHFSLSRIGEGNGTPLQYFWLENPRDGGAWLAAVYGVTQSWTQLKWLSSSSTLSWKCLYDLQMEMYAVDIQVWNLGSFGL